MKAEPLKDKIIEMKYTLKEDNSVHKINIFFEDDVKSAVEGLKNRIKKTQKIYIETHKEKRVNDHGMIYIEGSIDVFNYVLDEIDKWFEDVIE